MSEMVERVARALFDEQFNPGTSSLDRQFNSPASLLDECWVKPELEDTRYWFRQAAIKAIAAMREPTASMVIGGVTSSFAEDWRVAIDEALKP